MHIHLIYPHKRIIRAPYSIGWHVADALSLKYQVRLYEWDSFARIRPGPDDILIGHAHPVPGTIFRRNMHNPAWKRVIMMQPYNSGSNGMHMAWAESSFQASDCFLAITGKYWYSIMESSLFAHWKPKTIHVDMAVDRADFPALKHAFNLPQQRRFVYIGSDGWAKNIPYLRELADALPDTEFAWIGHAESQGRLKALGRLNFAEDSARALISQYDFMITVGHSDANPTTILEAMSWGLIPVSTRESGYIDEPGIVNIPLNDASSAIAILRQLQAASGDELLRMQAANWQRLDQHYNWERFTDQVLAAVEDRSTPPGTQINPWHRLRIASAEVRSPHFFLRNPRFTSAIQSAFRKVFARFSRHS